MDLLNENNDKNTIYQAYIKTLYEGLEIGSLKTYEGGNLYSAQYISEQQVKDLKNYKNNKIEDLPMSIIFSKSFLSFSKEQEVAEEFLYNPARKKNAMLIIKKRDKEYNLHTHADIESLSCFNEKEVLFFPFSAFGIENFWLNTSTNKYELELTYLGKYIKKV